MRPTRRSFLATGVLLGLAGCSPEAAPTPTPTQSSTPTPVPTPTPTPSPTPTPEPRAPLTGVAFTDPAVLTRPAAAVKVPNLKVEQPQWGIDSADVVIVQPNGDNSTRLVPIFQSRYPEAVGPVRSLRPADVPLLSPIFPALANTGAADWVLRYIDENSERIEKMTYLEFKKTGAFSVDKDRLYKSGGKTQYDRAIQAHPAVMAEIATRAKVPGHYLTFAPDAATSSAVGGKPATSIAVPYGDKTVMSYSFDQASGRYLRSQPWGEHVLADGTRVSTDGVLIIAADWEYKRIGKGRDAPDPVMDLIDATGPFTYAAGGTAVTGTWRKGGIAEPFELTTDAGEPLLLTPGTTWIELPRPTAAVTVS